MDYKIVRDKPPYRLCTKDITVSYDPDHSHYTEIKMPEQTLHIHIECEYEKFPKIYVWLTEEEDNG
jgi:hypothetical protein